MASNGERIMSVDLVYLAKFLNRPGVEGPRQVRGYVPARPGDFTGAAGQQPAGYAAIGASGVTIATGCDLGQTDAATLKAYGLPFALIGVFTPYLGLKKADAITTLARLPLFIAPDAAEAVDHAVHAGYLARYVMPAYNREALTPFADLPRQAQAVIFSVCFQKGCGGVRRDWPKTWGFLVRGAWAAAASELLTGFTQYANRRAIEGRLLQEVA